MNLTDIGSLVHERRQETGMSQAQLARLSGLSRATINQLESGTIQELGAVRLLGVLDLLGINLQANHLHRHRSALELASQTASVSYKKSLHPSELAEALVAGELPTHIVPHVATLLDEAPLSLLVSAVEEVANVYKQKPKLLWKNIAKLAKQVQSNRAAWE